MKIEIELKDLICSLLFYSTLTFFIGIAIGYYLVK
jgi:hypothetical protein